MTHSFINKIVDIELPFSYVDKDLVINGRADLIIKNKENKLEIIDYKSRYKEGLSRMNVDIQLRMYNLGLQNKYPEKIESISAYTFKDNQKTQFANSEEELQATRELISTISSSIESKVFKRNWKGSFCETKAGKCEFYYVCKNIEGEDKYVR
jgi:DNA helicase-2/ATP-dependent DNA helicase PcrA